MSITREQARAAAKRYVANVSADGGTEYVVVEELTREYDFGWVFFYNTRAYVETGDEMQMAVGNAPVIVSRDGAVHVTGTAHPVEHYIDLFRRSQAV
jgi:hypothetical protein